MTPTIHSRNCRWRHLAAEEEVTPTRPPPWRSLPPRHPHDITRWSPLNRSATHTTSSTMEAGHADTQGRPSAPASEKMPTPYAEQRHHRCCPMHLVSQLRPESCQDHLLSTRTDPLVQIRHRSQRGCHLHHGGRRYPVAGEGKPATDDPHPHLAPPKVTTPQSQI
jgi:hypothetical protein